MLKRAGVAGSNIIGVYKCSIRSEYLSAKLKSMQKGALKIVFQDRSYYEALTISGHESLKKRRFDISRKFLSTWRLRTCNEVINVPRNLRSGYEKSFRPYIRTKRANDFITFRFLD